MLRRIFSNPFSALIIALIVFTVMYLVSLFPADYKLGLFLQFTGTAALLTAIYLCLIWLVWRIRTVYADVKGISERITQDGKAQMVSYTYLSIAILMLAAAVISTG